MPDNAEMSRLVELIHRVPVAMLATAESSGELRSRPMQVQEADFDGTLRFFTAEHSPKMDEIESDRHVNLALSEPNEGIYLSLSGVARTNDDPAKKDELWKDEYKEWFPKGKDDPELVILEVKVRSAQWWVIPNPNDTAREQSREAEHGTLDL